MTYGTVAIILWAQPTTRVDYLRKRSVCQTCLLLITQNFESVTITEAELYLFGQ